MLIDIRTLEAIRGYFPRRAQNLVIGVVTWPNGADLDPLWMYDELRTGKTLSVLV